MALRRAALGAGGRACRIRGMGENAAEGFIRSTCTPALALSYSSQVHGVSVVRVLKAPAAGAGAALDGFTAFRRSSSPVVVSQQEAQAEAPQERAQQAGSSSEPSDTPASIAAVHTSATDTRQTDPLTRMRELSQQPDLVVRIFEQWRKGYLPEEFVPTVAAYHVYLQACYKDKTREKVGRRMEQAVAAMRADGLQPTVDTYNIWLRACAKSNSNVLGRAMQALAAEAEEGRVVPTMETFLAAASALCARREPLAALAQLRLIRQAGFDDVSEDSNMNTRRAFESLSLHASVVRMLLEQETWEQLEDVLDELHPRDIVLPLDVTGMVLQAAVGVNRPYLALLAVRFVELRATLNTRPVWVSEGEVSAALQLAARHQHVTLLHEALALQRFMGPYAVDRPPSVLFYHTRLEAHAACGQLHEAFAVLALITEHHPASEMEACTFDRLVQVLARSKQSVQAGWAVLEAMHAGGEAVCVPAVNVVLAAQARTRDMDAVFDTFLALSARLCLQPTTAVYNTLMEACWRCGRAEVVLLLRDEMLQKGLLPNAITVGHEVDALRQLGKYDDIRAVLKKCASQRLRHSDVPTISRMSCVRLNYSLRCQKIDHRTQTEFDYLMNKAFGTMDRHAYEYYDVFGSIDIRNTIQACRDEDLHRGPALRAVPGPRGAGLAEREVEAEVEVEAEGGGA